MKRIFIIIFTAVTAFSLFGCSNSKVEKEPVIITDSQDVSAEQITDSPTSNTNEEAVTEITNPPAAVSTNSETSDEDSSVQPSDDNGNTVKDSEGNNSDATYTSTIELEGMPEEVTYKYYQSPLGYQISYDMERFTPSIEDTFDIFMAENPDPEIYPYVSFNISRNEYNSGYEGLSTPDLLVANPFGDTTTFTEKDLDKESENHSVKIGDYEAVHYMIKEGNEWNSLIKHCYLVPAGNYYYVIQTQYFLEAAEGYGARIEAMLDTFTIQ